MQQETVEVNEEDIFVQNSGFFKAGAKMKEYETFELEQHKWPFLKKKERCFTILYSGLFSNPY